MLREKEVELKDAYRAEQIDTSAVALAWQASRWARKTKGCSIRGRRCRRLTDKSAVGAARPGARTARQLLEAGKPKEALVAFELTMKKEPNRFRGLYGGALAAETAGDRTKAVAYYKQLLEIAKDADTTRPELQRAKKAVEKPS